MSDRSVYKSSTGVSVPLLFTGRHLMQNLREAITTAHGEVLKAMQRDPEGRNVLPAMDWKRISEARLAIARYMSKLEANGFTDEHGYTSPMPHYLEALALARDDQLRTTLENRGYMVRKAIEPAPAVWTQSDELLQKTLRDRGYSVFPKGTPGFVSPIEAVRASTDSDIRTEAVRRGFLVSHAPVAPWDRDKLSYLSNHDVKLEFYRRGLQREGQPNMTGISPLPRLTDLVGKQVTVSVHGDITKVSTDDLLKEIKRRTEQVTYIVGMDFGKDPKKRKPKKVKAKKRVRK